jgi:hypothetical protein
LLPQWVVAAERRRLAQQPGLGLAGVLFVLPVAVALAFAMGGPEQSLLILAPLSTFALPAIAMIAFWWNDWPGSRFRAPFAGLLDTLLVILSAVVLTTLAQLVVGRIDFRGIFDATPGAGHPATFPATLPLAAAGFVAMLQLTLVSEGWPLRRFSPIPSGVAALAIAWAIALAGYLLFIDFHPRAGQGLHDRAGLVSGPEFGAWLVSLGVWQVLFFVALRGWPFSEMHRRWLRLLAGNVTVIGGGWLTYLAVHHVAGWENGTIAAVGGSVIASGLVVGMLFEGWPASRLTRVRGTLLTLAGVAVVAGALYALLASYADTVDWTKAEPEDWVSYVGLNAIGAGVILHVGIGLRWPFSDEPAAAEG